MRAHGRCMYMLPWLQHVYAAWARRRSPGSCRYLLHVCRLTALMAAACAGVLTAPALSRLAEKSPKAAPNRPPMTPDTPDLTKQLSITSWYRIWSAVGRVTVLNLAAGAAACCCGCWGAASVPDDDGYGPLPATAAAPPIPEPWPVAAMAAPAEVSARAWQLLHCCKVGRGTGRGTVGVGAEVGKPRVLTSESQRHTSQGASGLGSRCDWPSVAPVVRSEASRTQTTLTAWELHLSQEALIDLLAAVQPPPHVLPAPALSPFFPLNPLSPRHCFQPTTDHCQRSASPRRACTYLSCPIPSKAAASECSSGSVGLVFASSLPDPLAVLG